MNLKMDFFWLSFYVLFTIFIDINTVAGQYSPPVLHDMRFSSSYGELRNNHFHNGVDLRINHSEKYSYAVAMMDGVISRIGISPGGYGKLLVIDHTDSHSALYAHLEKFSPEIEEFVREYQRANKTFEMDLDGLDIPVRQGQVIGILGNTGASRGPHLHLEILKTGTDTSINPKLFGIKSDDRIPPVLEKLKIAGLDESMNIRNSRTYTINRIRPDSFTVNSGVIRYGAEQIGLAISGFDKLETGSFRKGIYKLSMVVNGDTTYSFKLDSIKRQHYLSYRAHVDHQELLAKERFHRLYFLPGNELDIYTARSEKAVIMPDSINPTEIEIIAEDLDGNRSVLKFDLLLDEKLMEFTPLLYDHFIPFGEKYDIIDQDFILRIDTNSFFKDTYMTVFKIYSTDYPNSISININGDAFKNKIGLFLRPDPLVKHADKLCIVRLNGNGNGNGNGSRNLGGEYMEGYLYAEIDQEGIYAIVADTVKPVIKPVRFRHDMRNRSSMSFTISDNLSDGITVPYLKTDAWINDEWVLFEYDKKTKRITHEFDKNLKAGKHSLKLLVTDFRGNFAEYISDFIK